MKNVNKIFILTSFTIVIFSFGMISCDLITNNQYIEEVSTISDLDDRACDFLSREFFTVDTIMTSTGTSIVTDTLLVILESKADSNTILLDSLIFNIDQIDVAQVSNLYDSIIVNLDTLIQDTTLQVTYTGNSSYLFFEGPYSGLMTAFVSWDFNGRNVNDYVELYLINRAGDVAEIHSLDIPFETISDCTQEYIIDTNTGDLAHTPVIKTRISFNIDESPYLMRIKVTQYISGTVQVPLHITLLEGN